MKTALTARALITPLERIADAMLVFEDGRITALGPRAGLSLPPGAQTLDFDDAVIAPGLIDIHIHGGAGHDVMEGNDDALAAVERLIAKHGVTSYFPTTVTAPVSDTIAALEKLGPAIQRATASPGRARPLGLHLEGPFISTAKCGVHPVKDILPPTLELFDRFSSASADTVKLMTVAPELPGAEDFIRQVSRRGVRVCLGHTDSLAEPARKAVAAGARSATHTFNAMRSLDHREPGILGVVLTHPLLMADIIVDGVHVADETVRLFLNAKGDERAILISDAISATGMPDGRYKLGNFEVEVQGDRCLLAGRLAGSVLTMDLAIRNVMRIADWELMRAVRLASYNPAHLMGIETKKGSLHVGADADVNILSPGGKVLQTFIGGISAG